MVSALVFLRPIWKLLAFGITIPLWLILAAVVVGGVWTWRERVAAVDEAEERLVTVAELEAAKAEADALRAINADQRAREDRLRAANKRISDDLYHAEKQLEGKNDRIDELAAMPVNPECRVDERFIDLLRGN